MIIYLIVSARGLRPGDRMSHGAARALDNGYDDVESVGCDVAVAAVKVVDRDESGAFIGEHIDVRLDDSDFSITASPTQRVRVARLRPET
ncbi:MAG: hypothetical protein ACRDQ0_13575 [Pseudonocardia sp.]